MTSQTILIVSFQVRFKTSRVHGKNYNYIYNYSLWGYDFLKLKLFNKTDNYKKLLFLSNEPKVVKIITIFFVYLLIYCGTETQFNNTYEHYVAQDVFFTSKLIQLLLFSHGMHYE